MFGLSSEMHALPAYGRDYKNKALLQADWDAGKDFLDAVSGRYFSKRDADKDNMTVWVRYGKGTKLHQVR